MTIGTIVANDRQKSYIAADGQTEFPYDFPIFTTDQLVISSTRAGVTTTLVETADYSVSGAGDQNFGTVTLAVGATAGDIILINGVTPIVRASGFLNTGVIGSQELNEDVDRALMVLQEQRRDIAGIVPGVPTGVAVIDSDTYQQLVIAMRTAQFASTFS